jgi:hypothetical protein
LVVNAVEKILTPAPFQKRHRHSSAALDFGEEGRGGEDFLLIPVKIYLYFTKAAYAGLSNGGRD